MSYVNENLMAGEHVEYAATIHWIVYMPSFAVFFIGVTLISTIGLWIMMAGALMGIYVYVSSAASELVITNKRVIAKVGWIRRETIELNYRKIESYQIDQSILGRLFGYGTVIINGTGGIRTPIPNIDNPVEFRKKAAEISDY